MTAPTPVVTTTKKLSLKKVGEDALAALVAFEGAVPTITALATSIHLPEADQQYIVAAGTVAAGVVSVLRQLLGQSVAAALKAKSAAK